MRVVLDKLRAKILKASRFDATQTVMFRNDLQIGCDKCLDNDSAEAFCLLTRLSQISVLVRYKARSEPI